MTRTSAPPAIPFVDYLVLGDEPYLEAQECAQCQARYFGRRNLCANCQSPTFVKVAVPREGEVKAFTIVHVASPGIAVPFVAAVVDCAGTSVRCNLSNVPPDPEHISVGMKVRLATYSMGLDGSGREAIGFAFEPIGS